MTTEEDFQAALDARIDDWQTRLVFADWLEEHGDPRAEGYRALGVLKLLPDLYGNYDNLSDHQGYPQRCYWGRRTNPNFTSWVNGASPVVPACLIEEWFGELKTAGGYEGHEQWWAYYTNRRDAENAAARAFAQLPAKLRAELLATENVPDPPPRPVARKSVRKRKRKK